MDRTLTPQRSCVLKIMILLLSGPVRSYSDSGTYRGLSGPLPEWYKSKSTGQNRGFGTGHVRRQNEVPTTVVQESRHRRLRGLLKVRRDTKRFITDEIHHEIPPDKIEDGLRDTDIRKGTSRSFSVSVSKQRRKGHF